ncbi:hypothetical protein EW145_g4712 [Phellinidium pouzarii]|uniref:Sodium/calcium exchanger membrane region domain-containing protein n=1 Tax=Phellinidium pouzarii TaxID=167371 RepID=A0A4S4L314_9AGAM|nr:hypothetical protein EW145_g4712 [Phellinidium pouzarii]
MTSLLPPTPPSPLLLSSRNPYNNGLAGSTSHVDVITEPVPTLVNRNPLRSSWVDFNDTDKTPASVHSQHSTHNQHHDHTTHLGAVERMEEGVHNFSEKFEHEFGRTGRRAMWDRFCGKNRRKIGWGESVRNVLKSSFLNVFLIFIPFAWTSAEHWKNNNLTFALCFLSIIPLEKLFDFGGEQMALYTGKDLGDLIVVSLNNAVEATLAIILLVHCELRILQATIVGVVLLHLLLVPGTSFLTGGAYIYEQSLHPHYTQLNHTLLAIGVLSLLIPAAFFAALDSSTSAQNTLTNSASQEQFLQMSRGIAILLFLVYVSSRIFLHNPPRKGNTRASARAELHRNEHHLHDTPKVNPWFCIVFLIINITIMAFTAEMLVESVVHVREQGNITEEWFGLILLPILSFSGDGTVAVIYFIRSALFLAPEPPKLLAEDRAIDLSIQFTLFWMPLFVLISWWTGRPLMLLFDLFEVAVLLAACFLVNYVTADSKTNWAEGYIMITFYVMIALCSWFYTGQGAISTLLSTCVDKDLQSDPLGEVAAVAEEAVGEVVDDLTRRMMMLI